MNELINGKCLESFLIRPEDQITFLYERKLLSPFTQSLLYFGSIIELPQFSKRVVLKVPNYKSQVTNEWVASNKAFNACLPTPEPLALIELNNGNRGIMFEFIEGDLLYKQNQPELRCQFGKIVKKMHTVLPVASRDWIKNEKSQISHFFRVRKTWGDLMISNDDFKRSLEIYDSIINGIIDYLPQLSPSFIHGDLHDGQLIINGENEFLIDFGQSREAQSILDLAIYCYHTLRTQSNVENISQFILGYLEHSCLSEKEKESLSFFILYTTLRSVEWYLKFRPNDINYVFSYISAINNFIENQSLWKMRI